MREARRIRRLASSADRLLVPWGFAPAIGLGLDRYASEPELRCMAFGTSAAASRLAGSNLA
jgi:hypothetical protein